MSKEEGVQSNFFDSIEAADKPVSVTVGPEIDQNDPRWKEIFEAGDYDDRNNYHEMERERQKQALRSNETTEWKRRVDEAKKIVQTRRTKIVPYSDQLEDLKRKK